MKVNDAMAIRRKELELTLDEVAKAVGVSKATVSRWESGEIDNMRRDRIAALAKILRVSPIFLMNEEVDMNDINNQSIPAVKNIMPLDLHPVPVIGRIAAGKPILANEHIEGYANVHGDVHADFALQVRGDSMVGARIMDGDLVFIHKQPEVEDGEIAAVLIDGDATLKRFYKRDGMVQLVAENPKYAPLLYTADNCDDIRILGKAVYFQSAIK